LLVGVAAAGCGSGGSAKSIAGRYDGGVVLEEDVQREAKRLPPILRARFESEAGRRGMVEAIIDQRLLAREARRREFDKKPETRREVLELEDRLVIQALLAAEEDAMGAPSEAELRAWYEGHRAELEEPDRVRVRRVLAAAPAGAAVAERERARARAERFVARLKAGERFEKVALDGDGRERAHGGDLGLLARNDSSDPGLVAAAFALGGPGARSPVVTVAEGFAVLELVERRAGRIPSFEEARGEVANRVTPARKRKAFDQLLARLRERADVRVESKESR
jgi:peptidyl-prolyl cis-trans isomerase C